MDLSYHKHKIPLPMRIIEGLSTGSMLISYLCCSIYEPTLLVVYMLHWFFSYNYHMHCSIKYQVLDTIAIDLLSLERISRVVGRYELYILTIISILTLLYISPTNYMCYGTKTFLTMLVSFIYTHDVEYLYASMMIAVLFILSEATFTNFMYLTSSITTIIFHLLLGWHSWIESAYYHPDDRSLLYICCLYMTYIFYLSREVLFDENRLKSVLTLTSSLVIGPLSLISIIQVFWYGYNYISIVQELILTLFISYSITDSFFGTFFYKKHMTKLDGYFHHIITSMPHIYALITRQHIMWMACGMMVELPTIVLTGTQVFPSFYKYKYKLLAPIFLLFRIIVPNIFLIIFRKETPIYLYIFHCLFFSMNLYWITLLCRKKKGYFTAL